MVSYCAVPSILLHIACQETCAAKHVANYSIIEIEILHSILSTPPSPPTQSNPQLYTKMAVLKGSAIL